MMRKQNKLVDCVTELGIPEFDLRNTWTIDSESIQYWGVFGYGAIAICGNREWVLSSAWSYRGVVSAQMTALKMHGKRDREERK